MRVVLVYDDRRGRRGFRPSWGFSCLVELEGRRLLFDAGGRDRILLHNLQEAGVEPRDVELVIVSHDHDDHVGGLPGLLDGNPGITVFASPSSELDVRRVNRVRNREEVVSGVLAVERPNNVGLLLESEEVLLAAREPGELVELVRWVCERWEVETVIAGFCRYPGAARIRQVAEVLGELGVGRVVGCHYFRPSDARHFERWGIECERPGVGEELEL
ncbi:MBL fold metallo-hydrolase [Methanopyrus kandleri]|uniref:Metal-dependent hydrolase of the beta-lactamase superfamily n=1 Tax=Methanopyrus kandleri (strain AV19 / DSM 6324 / JCM 9639 / NBRC 100938) TaxID=190192 RepID=Q8TVR5_METKA|nr:MBL fold metallo-hydrolase [Methanopyrus kandleri]AAM02536.1 Metal-dependent hydrolase of the beta-lactamase superfamily [Methanopyrus kandleri AV19]